MMKLFLNVLTYSSDHMHFITGVHYVALCRTPHYCQLQLQFSLLIKIGAMHTHIKTKNATITYTQSMWTKIKLKHTETHVATTISTEEDKHRWCQCGNLSKLTTWLVCHLGLMTASHKCKKSDEQTLKSEWLSECVLMHFFGIWNSNFICSTLICQE